VWMDDPYDWNSPQIIGLITGGVLALALFVLHENRTPEPMIPLSLFRNRVFRLSAAVGFIVGFIMIGTIIYLSLYLQVVLGASPTQSGLQLLPLVVGILLTSVLSGRMITRTGRYRIYPIVGTATAFLGLLLLSRLDAGTSYVQIAISMFVLGAGLGNVMQVLTVAVQNTIDPAHLGSATSASVFFRSIGSSFGAAGFGAVLGVGLAIRLDAVLASGASLPGISDARMSLGTIETLQAPAREVVINALADATGAVFLAVSPLMLVAFILTLRLPEIRLRRSGDTEHALASDAALPLPLIE